MQSSLRSGRVYEMRHNVKLKELYHSRHSSSAPPEEMRSPAGLPAPRPFWRQWCRQVQIAPRGTSPDLTQLALISLIKMEPDSSRDGYVHHDSVLSETALLS